MIVNVKKSAEEKLEIFKECARFIEMKKGSNVLLMDLRDVNSYLDYFIIVTGNSHIHCRSIAKAVSKNLAEQSLSSKNKPDLSSGWIILDYYDLIIHVFTEENRDFYQLEKLWADAKVISFK